MSAGRIRTIAVVRKELRDYRRSRFIVGTMAVYPLIFTALPIAQIFTIPASGAHAHLDRRVGLSLLFMLLIPTVVPAAIAAYSVVGEREQGTLEPVLTTPVRREELLLGKAIATILPSLAIAYAVFGAFLVAVQLFAAAAVASAVFRSSLLLAQVLFTPLLAGWSTWVGIAISTRASDVRVAMQLSVVSSIPAVAITSLMSFGVLAQTLALALSLAGILLVLDGAGWLLVSTLFDRERLITGRRQTA